MRINQPVYSIDMKKQDEMGISDHVLRRWIPQYLFSPKELVCGPLVWLLLCLSQLPIQLSIKLFLRPPRDVEGELDIDAVERRYDQVSPWYKWVHHLTTKWADDNWRNLLAQSVLSFVRGHEGRDAPKVLDLCCGTGLALEKILKTLHYSGLHAEIAGLDYSRGMLDRAWHLLSWTTRSNLQLYRGNAMDFVGEDDDTEFKKFQPGSFHVVTTMFGNGGIENPRAMAKNVLAVLKEGGQWFFTDMHEPLAHQPAKWPFLFWALELPSLEAVTYRYTTIPLALRRLWRWRDTTRDFYELPLTTWQDEEDQWWGFKTLSFEVSSQPWWLFNLPVMPVGKIILEKARISAEEVEMRQSILQLVTEDQQQA